MKQTELIRTPFETKKTDSPNERSTKNISYAKAVKLSPVKLKPTSSQGLLRDQIIEKMYQTCKRLRNRQFY